VSAAVFGYRAGDLVQLHPRERPFNDDPDWWWTVVSVSDLGLNVECGGRHRVGVGPSLIRDVEHRATERDAPVRSRGGLVTERRPE
jgi:hypothetical protein